MALSIGLDERGCDGVRVVRRDVSTDGNRCGLLDENVFKRCFRQDARDGVRGCAVAVGVFHAVECGGEVRRECAAECVEDELSVRWCVEDIAGALAALLAHAYVDDREGEGCGFHDSAGGVADHGVYLAEEAPVGDWVEVGEEVSIWPGGGEGLGALDESEAAGIGVGVDEEELAGVLGEG